MQWGSGLLPRRLGTISVHIVSFDDNILGYIQGFFGGMFVDDARAKSFFRTSDGKKFEPRTSDGELRL